MDYNFKEKLNKPSNTFVSVLMGNIVYLCNNLIEEFKNLSYNIVSEDKLNPGIQYICEKKPILYNILHKDIEDTFEHQQTPFIRNKKIYIHETFLSYTWIICYSINVIHHELILKSNESYHKKTELILNYDIIINAKILFDYGQSLLYTFSEWNKKLPNPCIYNESDKKYIESTNSLFLYAIMFILCHEFSHAELDHNNFKSDEISNGILKSLEDDADSRSLELLNIQDQKFDDTKNMGIAMALVTMLIMNKNITFETHPDIDDRIFNFLNFSNIEDNDNVYSILNIGISLWLEKYKVLNVDKGVLKNHKELFEASLNELLKYKFNN